MTKNPSRYFKKEIITTPLYLKSGAPVNFRRVNGNVGVLEAMDDTTAGLLGEASRKRIGGVMEIDEDTFRSLIGESPRAAVEANGHCSTWNGHKPDSDGIVTPASFYHSGDLGDVIYAMATVQELAKDGVGAVIHLGPDNQTPMPTREPMTPRRCQLIAPLLAAQPYVRRVEHSAALPPNTDFDLNQFRMSIIRDRADVTHGMNLARASLRHFGLSVELDAKPWLSVESPTVLDGKCVVMARTSRYHNSRFNWREIVRRYVKQSIFVGTEEEWRNFCREFGVVDYHKCADLLEVARVIAGAKLFIGNQSCPYAIAEGLKQNAILEVAPQAPNCMFSRPNAWAVWTTPFQLPNLDTLTNAVAPAAKKKIEFDENYFMRGRETGVSNYMNYSWMPDVTPKLAENIAAHLGIKKKDNLLDFGCSRGYLVRAFQQIVEVAHGCDISKWAIENCDESVKNDVFLAEELKGLNKSVDYDWVIAKDVLEHVPSEALESTVKELLSKAIKGMFIVVPLSAQDGAEFICPRDNQDATHITRWTLSTWLKFLRKIDQSFVYHGSFHIPGIKQASEPYEASCGFITAKKIDRLPQYEVNCFK